MKVESLRLQHTPGRERDWCNVFHMVIIAAYTRVNHSNDQIVQLVVQQTRPVMFPKKTLSRTVLLRQWPNTNPGFWLNQSTNNELSLALTGYYGLIVIIVTLWASLMMVKAVLKYCEFHTVALSKQGVSTLSWPITMAETALWVSLRSFKRLTWCLITEQKEKVQGRHTMHYGSHREVSRRQVRQRKQCGFQKKEYKEGSNKGSMELLRHVPCSVTATQEKK